MACMNEVVYTLKKVSDNPNLESRRSAGKLQAEIQYAKIEEILDGGLHAFLVQFLLRVNQIAAHVSREFLIAGPVLTHS